MRETVQAVVVALGGFAGAVGGCWLFDWAAAQWALLNHDYEAATEPHLYGLLGIVVGIPVGVCLVLWIEHRIYRD